MPFYPLPPLLVIFLAGVIFTTAIARDPTFILLAVGFVSLSLPVHLFMEMHFGWTNTTGRDGDNEGGIGGSGSISGGEALYSPLMTNEETEKESY